MTNSVLALMKAYKAPLTRENYLNWAFNGNPPNTLDPEEEAQVPEQFRLPTEVNTQAAFEPPKGVDHPQAHPSLQPAGAWADMVKPLGK